MDALKGNGFLPEVFTSKEAVFKRVLELIPQGASVMNGSSQTLQQIGLVDYLSGQDHGWNNLHARILAETDPEKQAQLRKECVISGYYLGSVHAVSETGEMIIASASGSQLSHLAYTSPNVILVVSTQKICPNLEVARERVAKHVVPLNDELMKSFGYPGSVMTQEFILHQEVYGRKFHVLFVTEALGF